MPCTISPFTDISYNAVRSDEIEVLLSSLLIQWQRAQTNNVFTAKIALYLFVLYTNIDLKLWNASHEQMHYKIGVSCVFKGHFKYSIKIT